MNQRYTTPGVLHETTALAHQKAEAFQLPAPAARLPGGFWRRAGAAMLDSIICSLLVMPVSFVFGAVLGMSGAFSGADPQSNVTLVLLVNLSSNLASLVAVFMYYGWFYKHKGATPGKMLLRLRVSYFDTGTSLTYGRAVARETVGKLLSGVLLGIGFLLVAFRHDKRGLHDILLHTQVTYEP
jgi:uncharacterized RDD family membrane protein YckC